jgi:hypothetical protein
MAEKHKGYSAYKSAVPRFLPSPISVVTAVPTLDRSSLVAAAAVPALAAALAFLLPTGSVR